MVKRVVAALLWFYALWYAGAMLTAFLGVPDLLGPIVGAAAAVLIGFDPRGVIWSPKTAAVRSRLEAVRVS